MKIVILSGFTSSSVFDPDSNFREDESSYAFMGGRDFRSQFDDADVVIAVWSPSSEPIVIDMPDGVEVKGAVWKHMTPPRLVDAVTPQEWKDRRFDG